MKGDSVVKGKNAEGTDYKDIRSMSKLRASIAESVRKSKADLATMQNNYLS